MADPSAEIGVATRHRDFVVSRIRALTASPTIAVAKEAQRLRRAGVDVVDFGPGEPDFDTPVHVRRAAAAALEAGLTHYAPSRGFPELLTAIGAKLQRDNGLPYEPSTEIVVTPGAKQAIVEAVMTAAEPGDEVLMFDPGWGSYDAIVRLAGAIPVHVQLREDFSLEEEALLRAIGPRTRALVIGSPGNPTGSVLSARDLDTLTRICCEHDLLLISDEIYERITYRGLKPVSPATLPGMWERTVTINGFSKAYAMTGWRLGYAAAPEGFMSQMLKVHEHTVTSATSFAQMGGVAALNGPEEPLKAMVAEFDRRREIIVRGLNSIPGVRCDWPDGAFYVFPNIEGTGMTGTEYAVRLLAAGVAVTPGVGFGERWDTHIRLSYATSEERIQSGLTRMREAVA